MPVLIDTSFLLAISSPGDINHRRARETMQLLRSSRVVPVPVLPELFNILSTRTNYLTAVRVFNTLRSSTFQIEALTKADLARMTEIMTEYSDSVFDFTDTAIMALSERLDIDTIYTFDRRHFSVFRPRHRPFLQLLP